MAATTAQAAKAILNDEALAEEDLLDELENGELPAELREARMAEFKQQAVNFHMFREKQHGQYTEIAQEKEFLEMTTSEEKCVIHFYHEDFRRCAILDSHLQTLSEKYFETKFAKISVDKATFFVEKLKIKILPAIICFKNGIVVDRVIGFEELGNTDDFPTMVLERRLAHSGVIESGNLEDETKSRTLFGYQKKGDADDSDDSDY